MPKSLLRKSLSGSIHQYIAAIVTAIFSFLITIYIIQRFAVEEFGIYNFVLSIILVAQIITSLGLTPVIQRYLPEYKEKGNNYLQKRIVTGAMLIRFLVALVFIFILLASTTKVIDIFNLPDYSNNLFPIIALIILLVLESQLLGDAALVTLFENRYWNLSKIVYSITKFTLFYLVISFGYGLIGIMWAWLVVELLLFILFLVKGYHVIFSLPVRKENVQKLPIKRFISFGGYLYFHQLGYFLRDKATDVFLLSYFLGTHAVGLYSFAFGVPLLLMGFSPGSKLRPILYPLVVQRYTKTNSKDELSYFFKFINRIIFFTMVPVFVISMILADKIILYVFNPDYLKVTNLFMLSLGIMMILQFVYAYSSILYALEKSRIIFIGILASIYNLTMDVILIPIYGILGAILATGSAGIILLFYYHYALKKTINLPYPWRSFSKFSFNTLIAALVVFLMQGFVNNILSLFLVMFVGGLLYLMVSYLNKGFEKKDRNILNRAIGKEVWVF